LTFTCYFPPLGSTRCRKWAWLRRCHPVARCTAFSSDNYFSLSVFCISRTLHSKLRLGSNSSSSLTDLSQAKTGGGGGEGGGGGGGGGGGTTGGLAEECSRDRGTQQRRAGTNATWNRLVCEPWSVHLTYLTEYVFVGLAYTPGEAVTPACSDTRRHVCSCAFFPRVNIAGGKALLAP